jgi:hypothetical protein
MNDTSRAKPNDGILEDYHVEFLAWHLEMADAHANALGGSNL